MTLSIAVAAKGICDPGSFIEALMRELAPGSTDVDIHIAYDKNWHEDYSDLDDVIKLHKCSEETSVLRLWGMAIACCEGEYVAILDIHSPPDTGWLKCVQLQIRHKTPLFFGSVEPGWKKNDIRIVGYLAEYAQFSKPLTSTLDEVPGNNVVCHRSLLDDPSRLVSEGFFKTFMVWRLEQEMALKPQKIEAMAVNYYKPFSRKRYMARRYQHGRCFGATRHDNAGQPPRTLCMIFTLVLPVVRIWRIYRAVRKRSDLRHAFFSFFYLIVQSEVAWSYGEMKGYIDRDRSVCTQLD